MDGMPVGDQVSGISVSHTAGNDVTGLCGEAQTEMI